MADDFIMEHRKESLISPITGLPSHRLAHFLKPSVASPEASAAAPSLVPSTTGAEKSPLKSTFVGWKITPKKWKKWVEDMSSSHRSTWESAGILDAIMSSTITIHRSKDLLFGFLEKWCDTTNSFVFPWGEATLTLEDMAVLGGYSVFGERALSASERGEVGEIEKKLRKARSVISRCKSKKPMVGPWMEKFMGSQSEIEHEAFLVYWLSRFVFPIASGTVNGDVLSIAVRLGRGAKIALAPAVLAGIYRSLSLLKAGVNFSRKPEAKNGDAVNIAVSAPLALVQIWIWERFPTLSPTPVGLNKPRMCRWGGLKKVKTENLLSAIDAAGAEFVWRPYKGNGFPEKLYQDCGYWAVVDSDVDEDEDLEGFIRCLRASELVGLSSDPNSIKQYLPHRVAMQFGLDQDIPGHVPRVNVNVNIAWADFTRPVKDSEVYIPGNLSVPQCTIRYADWWKKLHRGLKKDHVNDALEGQNVQETKNVTVVGVKFEDDDFPPPPGFPPKGKGIVFKQSPALSSPGAARSPKSGLSGISKGVKRKILDGSNAKIVDYYTPVSPGGSALKKRNESKGPHSSMTESEKASDQVSGNCSHRRDDEMHKKDHSSFRDEDVAEPGASTRVDAGEEAGDVRKMKMMDGNCPSPVESSSTADTGLVERLEQRIGRLERLVASLKSEKRSDLPVPK
ncbi:uncharacterized protein LOC127265828 [Andrographis paniculata]|uniref:uncharacterized protein LOC127265828 n=1 Tax=Andrographis paniculata TaxID=175694 RepID=UPI0021E8128D|nr:uncharacterized protein LOC127265828 [Andrographis paniculata]